MLSRRRAQPPCKLLQRLPHKFHALGRFLWRLVREHIIGYVLIEHAALNAMFLLIRQRPVVGLATVEDRVNRPIEGPHAVIFFVRPPVQPFHIPIRPGDITVRACRDRNDDLPLFHNASLQGSSSPKGRYFALLRVSAVKNADLRSDPCTGNTSPDDRLPSPLPA